MLDPHAHTFPSISNAIPNYAPILTSLTFFSRTYTIIGVKNSPKTPAPQMYRFPCIQIAALWSQHEILSIYTPSNS